MSHETLNPTQPKIELKIGKKTHELVFTFKALAVAEAELKKAGEPVNIFNALNFEDLNATSLVALLYAALITHSPEIKLESLPSLITMKRIPAIKQALFDAFVLAFAEPEEEDEAPLVETPNKGK